MGTFQNGVVGPVAPSHAQKEWEQEKGHVPIHHQLMQKTAQEVMQTRQVVTKDHAQVSKIFISFFQLFFSFRFPRDYQLSHLF